MIVAKFGGSSLANAAQFQKVREIILADSRRTLIVPSAPGKRFEEDEKVTDLLYRCHLEQTRGQSFLKTFERIQERYLQIAAELNISLNLLPYFEEIKEKIVKGASADYCASRGEYLNGLLLADYLGFTFLDAAEVIYFDEKGFFNAEKTNFQLKKRLEVLKHVVIPGFYGSMPDGTIHVFSRGGSDVTGAIVARASQAETYENWTDVSGFLMADPRIVDSPKSIRHITYQEMHELCCAGATVLHEESVFPVCSAGIPTNIRNTNLPKHQGTMITCTAVQREEFAIFAGLAGKKGFSLVVVEKERKERTWGFVQKVLQGAENCGFAFQYLPSGSNCVCLLVDTKKFASMENLFQKELANMERSHTLSIRHKVAGIVLVGYGIVHNREAVNRIYAVLRQNNIEVVVINQGNCELSTWVGVAEHEMEEAIRVIYETFAE